VKFVHPAVFGMVVDDDDVDDDDDERTNFNVA